MAQRDRTLSCAAPSIVEELHDQVSSELTRGRNGLLCLSRSTRPTYTFMFPKSVFQFRKDFQDHIVSELCDEDVQEPLETLKVVNWDPAQSRLLALRTDSDHGCLLHAASLGLWGVQDRQRILRDAVLANLTDEQAGAAFRQRWEYQTNRQNKLDGFELTPEQIHEEWATTVRLAGSLDESLEAIHVFVLAHVLRRPIIVYSDNFTRDVDGQPLHPVRFGGLYLPLMVSSPGDCARAPLALAYHNSHFSSLVPMEGAEPSPPLLSLTAASGELLPVQFATDEELTHGRQRLILEWLDVKLASNERPAAQLVTGQRREFYDQLLSQYFDASAVRFQQKQEEEAQHMAMVEEQRAILAQYGGDNNADGGGGASGSDGVVTYGQVSDVPGQAGSGDTVSALPSGTTTTTTTTTTTGGGVSSIGDPLGFMSPAGRVEIEGVVRAQLDQLTLTGAGGVGDVDGEGDIPVLQRVPSTTLQIWDIFVSAVQGRQLLGLHKTNINAYCKIKYGDVKKKTKPVKNTAAPTWPDNSMQFTVEIAAGALPHGSLSVAVWDHDRVGRNTELGAGLLDVGHLVGHGTDKTSSGEVWIELTRGGASSSLAAGQVLVQWKSYLRDNR